MGHNLRVSSIALRYLSPNEVHLSMPPSAVHPRMELDTETHDDVKLVAVFPLTRREEYISVIDSEGKEIGILPSLEDMDAASKEIVREQLNRRYFSPEIETIHSLKLEAGMWLFDVTTQRGRMEFYVRGWRDSAHEVTRGHWQISSVDGQRFDILDYEELDERSKTLLDKVF